MGQQSELSLRLSAAVLYGIVKVFSKRILIFHNDIANELKHL
jgi:hypothetical protein